MQYAYFYPTRFEFQTLNKNLWNQYFKNIRSDQYQNLIITINAMRPSPEISALDSDYSRKLKVYNHLFFIYVFFYLYFHCKYIFMTS